MKQIPFFSIIVPIYKVEKYLHQCIDSLINQDFDNYEIILVDDGSPDSCPVICDEYAAQNSKIKVVHKPNGGLSDARNAGIAVAKGVYVTFVDSDDFWRGGDILSGVNEIIKNNKFPDIIVSDFIKFYDKSDKYLEPSMICSECINGQSKLEVLKYLYYEQADLKMSAWQKFLKKELLINSNFEKGLLSEDIDWSLKVYPKAKSIAVYNKPYYCYRQQREGSITNTASKRSFDSLMYILDKWEKQIPLLSIPIEEQEIYIGYLAYQLAVSMALYCNLENRERSAAIRQIEQHKNLLHHKLNKKTVRVKYLVQLLGIKNTCLILRSFLKLRGSLKMG